MPHSAPRQGRGGEVLLLGLARERRDGGAADRRRGEQ
jgi:hypothetical protein